MKCETCGQERPITTEKIDGDVWAALDEGGTLFPIRIVSMRNPANEWDGEVDRVCVSDAVIMTKGDARKLAAFIYRHTSAADE